MRARRQHVRIHADEPRMEERQAERDQHRGGSEARRRIPHHPVGEPVPAAALVGSRGALGRPLPTGRRECVHPRAEQCEERGQHRQRDEARERSDDQPSDRHRAQEAEREDEQRAERGGDGDRTERDRAAGRLHRHPQRLCARPVAHELLPIARHEQQAVVDREAEPRAGDEVEREDGDRRHAVDDADQREREHDQSPPASIGSAAATTPRKTQSASRKSSGNAISSARKRSCSDCDRTSSFARWSRQPPPATWRPGASRRRDARRCLRGTTR